MDGKNSVYIIGGPRAAGKSTLLDRADTDTAVLNTENHLYQIVSEKKNIRNKEQLLEEGVSEETGRKLVDRIYDECRGRDMILDTYFYRKGYLGLPRKNIEYIKEKFEDTEFYIAHITCDMKPLMDRREKRELDSRFRKAFDDKQGNDYGFKIYREILQKDPRKSFTLNNYDIDESVELIEKFLDGQEVCCRL